jgi:hypothetical protein
MTSEISEDLFMAILSMDSFNRDHDPEIPTDLTNP